MSPSNSSTKLTKQTKTKQNKMILMINEFNRKRFLENEMISIQRVYLSQNITVCMYNYHYEEPV